MLNVILHSFGSPVVAQQPQPAPGGLNFMFIAMPLFLAAMYFLSIAPQRKKEKEHKKLLASIVSGDEVLTAGGIYGVVTNVKEDRLLVRIAEGTKIEVARSFITSVDKKAATS